MHFAKMALALSFLLTAASPSLAQDTTPTLDPNGSFVDSYGTSFSFTLCGDAGTDLCGVLTSLKGASATAENLPFVGKQIIEAKQSAPNEWKGTLDAGSFSGDATITLASPDTIEIKGCKAVILCKTLAYNRT